MFVRLEGKQIGFPTIGARLYTVHDTEFIDTFEFHDGWPRFRTIETQFQDFLQEFWNLYEIKNKNPMVNLIVLMTQYGAFKHKDFVNFLNSKGFRKDNYEKYMVLV